MSADAASSSQVAVLGAPQRVRASRDRAPARPTVRLVTFGLLALYGTLRWSTLLRGGAVGRLLGLLALALLLVAGRGALAKRSRLLAAVATFLLLLGALAISGVPLAWIVHLRIAVTARAIGQGLSALPQVLVPYSGADRWVTLVIVLGEAVLLFDAALLLAFAPRAMEDFRRAGAALPLIALAAVPTTLVRPSAPYLDGGLLFALLVAFMWGEQIGSRRIGGALFVGGLAAIAAMFLAPAIDQHKPWFNYRGLAGTGSPIALDAFDWTQGYGPVDWPQNGRTVLTIKARDGEYWKTENLGTFNGVGWTNDAVPGAASTPAPDASALNRWTQTITVKVGDMRSSDVIGAGTGLAPTGLPQDPAQGQSPGTWVAGSQLVPGDSYQMSVYAPDPNGAELGAAGANYVGLPPGYFTIELPPTTGTPSPASQFLPGEKLSGYQAQLVFPTFHSGRPIRVSGGPHLASAATLLAASGRTNGYALSDVYSLAQHLADHAATPYQFVQEVESYLSQGYVYNEDPPRTSYPLQSFLLSTRRGYCQQFAGAMALLLRMGGVPARVAVGFTSGRQDPKTGSWLVADYDAHAWVEAWFPHYGWVTFDPTPPADPALGGHRSIFGVTGTNIAATGTGLTASKQHGHHGAANHRRGTPGHARGSARAGSDAGAELSLIAGVAVVVLLATLALTATKPLRSAEALVGELEGALRRVGRPLPAGATLTGLERRVSRSQDAADYVHALQLARFGRDAARPTGRQRRAMRRELRLGGGLLRGLRALWALPPRWAPPGNRPRRGPATGAKPRRA